MKFTFFANSKIPTVDNQHITVTILAKLFLTDNAMEHRGKPGFTPRYFGLYT